VVGHDLHQSSLLATANVPAAVVEDVGGSALMKQPCSLIHADPPRDINPDSRR
jgi:hypothetical protein